MTADRSSQPAGEDLIGQRTRRIQKLEALRAMGINPFPSEVTKELSHQQILEQFSPRENTQITTAGRLMTLRDHGKIAFADLQDQTGTIQIVLRKESLVADHEKGLLGWDDRSLLDIGDHIQISGTVGTTTAGQQSIFATELKIIAKSIRPLPNTIDEKEAQFRRRYVDLTLNQERRRLFERKSRFWQLSRQFMEEKGFIEVEVPVLEHVTGGADATPFVTYHQDLGQEFYLRISTELYQKRLVGGGFEKIYTLGPNFRNEGSSDEHLQEYSQLEWYWAYASYRDSMQLVQEIIRTIAQQLYGTTSFTSRGHTFDLADEWTEIDYVETIKHHHSIDIFTDSDDKMLARLKELGVNLPGAINRHRLIDNLWKQIRKTIAGPAFLVNEPAFLSPLAKAKTDDPRLTERFHIIIGGSELGNGYSEINDPQYQLDQFLDQQRLRDTGDDEAQMLDIDFVEMLEYGMPPTSGYAHSERLFWYLEDITSREGVLFPQLKHDVDAHTIQIYGDRLADAKISLRKPAQTQTSNADACTVSLDRDTILRIVDDNTQNKNLVRHGLAVEAAMRALASHFSADEQTWGLLGLVHDADWEQTEEDPRTHTQKTIEWLREAGEDNPAFLRAIQAHNVTYTDVEPQSLMEWALFTCDELTGLITATALMQPDKKLSSVTVASVQKKFKNKKFAAAIDRDQIAQCEDRLGLPLAQFIEVVLGGMQHSADQLGLA